MPMNSKLCLDTGLQSAILLLHINLLSYKLSHVKCNQIAIFIIGTNQSNNCALSCVKRRVHVQTYGQIAATSIL